MSYIFKCKDKQLSSCGLHNDVNGFNELLTKTEAGFRDTFLYLICATMWSSSVFSGQRLGVELDPE